ncbi:heterokaryon incompatibility protein-domain-containing protein [Xylariales sp. PMI_506]|nr:heterokaryon incompatibility protein-domain-containing protein [Xylariales sp. PMI_506]
MGLCSCCENIVRARPESLDLIAERKQTLSLSAKSCHLCAMIQMYLLNHSGSDDREHPEHQDQWEKPGRIFCIWFESTGGFLTSVQLEHGLGVLRIGLWADERSPASTDSFVTSRQPLKSNEPDEIASLVQPWVSLCLTSHEACTETIAGELLNDKNGTKLPTRVIRINNPGLGLDMVKLVEPGDLISHYCALSYCWGASDKHPYKTTTTNLRQLSAGVPASDLPRIFRDAIALTRSIGVDYLWIDSLCIIQDDTDDWSRESEKMGEFFERAFLVIAAAGARDSTESLFSIPRYPHLTVQVPYYRKGDQYSSGSFNMTMLSRGEDKPYFGPLYNRGWASQEWNLARRVVFFSPGGISWMCNEDAINELQCQQDFRIYTPFIRWSSTSEWLWYLRGYSRTRFSRHTDRLIAIQGVTNELQKMRPDLYYLGVWTKDLEVQLLWLPNENLPSEDIPDLPSWCWASLGGSKAFMGCLPEIHQSFSKLLVVNRLSINPKSRTIEGGGTMGQVSLRAGGQPINNCCLSFYWSQYRALEGAFLENDKDDCVSSIFELLDDQSPRTTLGIANFDRDIHLNPFVLRLVSTPRLPTDALPRFYPKHQTGKDTCVDLHPITGGSYVDWALLVVPTDASNKQFKRVGLALLYPSQRTSPEIDIPYFEIV